MAVGKTRSAIRKVAAAARTVPRKAGDKAKDVVQDNHGPSPNPVTNLVIADIALRAGALLVRRGVERGVLGVKYSPEKANDIMKARTMAQTLVGTAIARVATRSVPGAILVGGAMLAKTLYDRSKGKREAQAEGEAQLARIAEEGRKS